MGSILRKSWEIYSRNFWLIVAVTVAISLPIELLCSYMDAFVFGEEEVRKSFRFSQLRENTFGIIATSGLVFIGGKHLAGETPTFGGAMGAGFSNWPRMWWTRFLAGILLVIALLLLVVPGIYLFVRLSLLEVVVVQERLSGSAAIRRSYALTEKKFWLLFGLGMLYFAVIILPSLAFGFLSGFFPVLDHWLITALFNLICDVFGSLGTIALISAYWHFNSLGSAQPLSQSPLTAPPSLN